MPKRVPEMSALEVARLKPPGAYVGGIPGLYLAVGESSKSWLLSFSLHGRRPEMGLGGYPEVTLAKARETARAAKALVRQGINPIEARNAGRSAALAKSLRTQTFSEVADKYIRAHEADWRSVKHGKQWRATLATYAEPKIGALNVEDVTVEHVLAIVEPLWAKKHETAKRVRGRVEAVLAYAIARNFRPKPNPAALKDNLAPLLAKTKNLGKVTHHRALEVDEVPAFMERLRGADGQGARALEFAILTAARSGEVRGAVWAEIDLQRALWIVPADRMKADREHRVALSPAAVDLLRRLPESAGDALLFPGAKGQPLSDMTLTAVLRRLEVDSTAHGFRACFKTWAGERTSIPREVVEAALAHKLPDKVEASYMRGDFLAKRQALMSQWGVFCTSPPAPANVTQIRKGRT